MANKENDKVIQSLDKFADVITGVASAKRNEWAASAGYLVRGLWQFDLIERIKQEWLYYAQKGEIPKDVSDSSQFRSALLELLDAIENEILDEEKFNILRKIFFITVAEGVYKRDSVKPYQFMRVGRSLNTGEILVLFACYRISLDQEEWQEDKTNARNSLIRIARESGLAHPELVEVHEETLIEKKLIHKRALSDNSGIYVERKERYRLTSYGYAFCKYIEHYDLELGMENKSP